MNVTSRGAHITANSIKLVVLLDPTALRAALQPYARVEHRIPLAITVACRRLTAEFAPRAVRKALAAVAEHGPEAVVCMVQGRLLADSSIGEAGLMVQPKKRAEGCG
jgi:hypothetical protein